MFVYTNFRLHKIDSKDYALCNMCMTDTDSNEHMLLRYPVNVSFWQDIENWVAQLCDSRNDLSNNRTILKDLKNQHIIVFGKVCLHKSKINDKLPSLFLFQNLPKRTYIKEKCIARSRNKESRFEREWFLLYSIWNCHFCKMVIRKWLIIFR